MQELSHRKGLTIALGNRDETQLEPILLFIIKKINNPIYSEILIACSNTILDIYYKSVIGFEDLIAKLFKRVEREVVLLYRITETLGLMDSLLSK